MRCLRELLRQTGELESGGTGCRFAFYICDDNSQDGTVDSIRALQGDIRLFVSSGNLYWSRGMHKAMEMAREDDPDVYLMINDDVLFYNDALKMLLQNYGYYSKQYDAFGLVANIIEETDRELLYGGRGTDGKLIPSGEKNVECMLANWNCFLLTREVIQKVGLIDPVYEHAFGDFDYSFMMGRASIPIFLADRPAGECEENKEQGTYTDITLSKRKRLKLFFSPKGMPPRSYFHFYFKNHRELGIYTIVVGYISILWYILIDRDIRNSNR